MIEKIPPDRIQLEDDDPYTTYISDEDEPKEAGRVFAIIVAVIITTILGILMLLY